MGVLHFSTTLDPRVKSRPGPIRLGVPTGHDGPVTTVVTWNLQGRMQPDLGAVAAVLTSLEADVIALQEVQRDQAEALADALGHMVGWAFKHWPVVARPEGLALMAPVFDQLERTVLAHRWQLWSWRRRVALSARILGDRGFRIVDAHLGADVDDVERLRQAKIVLGLDPRADFVVGDMNARPGGVVVEHLARAGYRDAWATCRGDEPGHTNWSLGPRDGAPDQRLDFVFVAEGWEVVDAEVAGPEWEGIDLAALSDHLPLRVEVRPVAT